MGSDFWANQKGNLQVDADHMILNAGHSRVCGQIISLQIGELAVVCIHLIHQLLQLASQPRNWNQFMPYIFIPSEVELNWYMHGIESKAQERRSAIIALHLEQLLLSRGAP